MHPSLLLQSPMTVLPCQKCVNKTGTSFFHNACICEKTPGIKPPPLGCVWFPAANKIKYFTQNQIKVSQKEEVIKNDSTQYQKKIAVMPTHILGKK